MRLLRVHLATWAASTVQIHAEEDWSDDAPDLEAVCAAWRNAPGSDHLAVAPDAVETVWRGLIDLANAEDTDAGRRDLPAEERRIARHASDGLSAAATRLLKLAHQ